MVRYSELFFCMELYYFVQAAASVIRNSEVVCYSGVATVLYIVHRLIPYDELNVKNYFVGHVYALSDGARVYRME